MFATTEAKTIKIVRNIFTQTIVTQKLGDINRTDREALCPVNPAKQAPIQNQIFVHLSTYLQNTTKKLAKIQ